MYYFITDIVSIIGNSDEHFVQYVLDEEVDIMDGDDETKHNGNELKEEEEIDNNNDDEFVMNDNKSDNDTMDNDDETEHNDKEWKKKKSLMMIMMMIM
eukprot:3954557-Ditylum_brightwellii.AAC.1